MKTSIKNYNKYVSFSINKRCQSFIQIKFSVMLVVNILNMTACHQNALARAYKYIK